MQEQVRGKAAMDLWREYAGGLATTTLVMGLGGPALFAGLLVVGSLGLLSWWVVAPLQTALAYSMFIAMHDAAHGSIGGRADRAWMDELVGWLVAGVFCSSYHFFKWSHLQHHAHVNHPTRDPDRWVAGPSLPLVFVRCLTVIPGYYLRLLRADRSRLSARVAQRNTVLGALPVFACMAAYAWFAGAPALVALWVAPALVASGLLGFVFDYLPHHPHEATGRFDSSGFAPPSWRDSTWAYLLTFGQTHHPVHHLFPRVPWYRYRALYGRIHAELALRGVPNAALQAHVPSTAPEVS